MLQLDFHWILIDVLITGAAKIPLALYGSQLVLNWAWPPLFFVFHQLKWVSTPIKSENVYLFTFNLFYEQIKIICVLCQQSLVEICALSINVAGCIATFHRVNKTASYIMVPYLVWLSLATSLTYYIYKHNPDVDWMMVD